VQLHTLQHALNDLLDWGGSHKLRLLHSSEDFTSGAPNLMNMYNSIAHKGPTVTAFHADRKVVGVYLEKPWSYRNSHIHVRGSCSPLLLHLVMCVSIRSMTRTPSVPMFCTLAADLLLITFPG
jgi:hypothetical protein